MGIGKPRVCLSQIGLLEYFGTFFIRSEEGIIWSTVLDLGKMFSSEKVKLKLKDGQVLVNKSNVIKADINTANGVIHIIDKVLLPKDRTQKTSTK